MSAPRLATLARLINERFPRWEAKLVPWSETPYRRPRGLRYRTWVGKTRHGHKLVVVVRRSRRVVLDHNPLETYRTNGEVVRWIEEEAPRLYGLPD